MIKEEKQELLSIQSTKTTASDAEVKLNECLVDIKGDIDAIKQDVFNLTKKQEENVTTHDISVIKSEIKSSKTEVMNMKNEMINKINALSDKQNYPTQRQPPHSKPNTEEKKSTDNKPKQSSGNDKDPIVIEDSDKKYKILILGDSVTRVLKTGKMLTDKTDVKIKTQGGAHIKDIHIKTHTLLASQPDIKDTDVFVIHAGINNVSNNDQPKDIKEQMHELTKLLQETSTKAKVIVSSVLPMKSISPPVDTIRNVNIQLKNLCDEKKFTFIDHTSSFMKDGQVNQNLYYGEVHLNDHGAAILANKIKATVRKVLNINLRKTQVNFPQARHFHKTPREHQNSKQFQPWRTQQFQPWRTPQFHNGAGVWRLPPWMYLCPPYLR